uniref:signal recognition particle-docking protein FtsY n=1 Tax=Ningiella ruwaisensis TaxID=2364274 RepID=UPI001F4FDC0F|nr:signal recognition particle-docking protein FtsY [Ningiella ruwaisensis]
MFNWFKKDKEKNKEALPTEQEKAEQEKAEQEKAEQEKAEQEKTELKESQENGAPSAQEKATQTQKTQQEKTQEEVTKEEVTKEAASPEVANQDFLKQEQLKQEPLNKEAALQKEKSESGFFSKLRASLSRTKENIGSGFIALLKGKEIDDELYEELETQLLLADVGMQTTTKIINNLTKSAKMSQLKNSDALAAMLKQHMRDILEPVNQDLEMDAGFDEQGNKLPFVILMVGVNGVGKTTTIGKLAKQFQGQGKKVMLAAGDTFRAAAVEQLQVWGERNNIGVIAQPTGADSASVIFDALASAKAKGADVLIADTAGRLQNKDNLIEELKKVVRVMKKQIPQAPHEIMLTLDASTGQNAVSQTRIFNDAVGITGINLTKLDGTAKGGVIFALADEFKIPVRYIGIGEGIDDLRPFSAQAFVDALFDDDAQK